MSSRIEVVETRRGRRAFVELARRFRGGSRYYVPQLTGEVLRLLDPDKNPIFRHAEQRLWIARDAAGAATGRIAASYDPRHAESLGESAGWFGFFDAADAATAAELIATARDWLTALGAASMLGPADPDTNHECGCLIEGFDDLPYLMMPHHPREYGGWIEAAGLSKAKDLLAFETDAERMRAPQEQLTRIADQVLKRGDFRLEPITKRGFDRQIRAAHEVYQSAWRDNWGFLPMDLEEFQFETAGMKMLLDPSIAWLAWKDDRPAGVAIALPDANQALHRVNGRLLPFGIFRLPFLLKRIKRIRTVMLGVVSDFRHRGLDLALVQRLVSHGLEAGYDRSEMSWILEDNEVMLKLARHYGGELTRRYRLYRCSLGGA